MSEPISFARWIRVVLIAVVTVPLVATAAWTMVAIPSNLEVPGRYPGLLIVSMFGAAGLLTAEQARCAAAWDNTKPIYAQGIALAAGIVSCPVVGVIGILLIGPLFGIEFHLF